MGHFGKAHQHPAVWFRPQSQCGHVGPSRHLPLWSLVGSSWHFVQTGDLGGQKKADRHMCSSLGQTGRFMPFLLPLTPSSPSSSSTFVHLRRLVSCAELRSRVSGRFPASRLDHQDHATRPLAGDTGVWFVHVCTTWKPSPKWKLDTSSHRNTCVVAYTASACAGGS